MTETTALTVHRQEPLSVFSGEEAFSTAQRICRALCSSNLVPESYRGENMGNALIALDIANRMRIPPLMVMQNLHVIEGRPSWASNFIIAALNACGLFSPIRFRVTDLGERDATTYEWTGPKGARERVAKNVKIHDKEFIAYAVERGTGEVLEGPPVTLSMAVSEGWYYRSGSKWPSMPDLMGRYRAAAFFGRLYAPHVLNGMPAVDEVQDTAFDTVPLKGEVIEADPVAKPDEKPAGRPKGVHAALKKAEEAKQAVEEKPAEKKAAKRPLSEPEPAPKDEAPAQDASAGEIIDADYTDADDVFDAPGEDDGYSPD
ncbi:hypothetical protein [Rhodomicrobium lacus]|uniref:hypothetical protein n=1 Tax=Rhodomicrobium lacus TaxID=2498452 RepID=UPI000F8F7984|nr:hypothetical protein [Rhodomicrobium lacus]